MSISSETLALARELQAALDPPDIAGLHLPDLSADDDYRDEFGFVFLEDGTAAPFYVSLPGTLEALRARFPEPARVRWALHECLDGWSSPSLPGRALALGAWNALSQHLLRCAEFVFPRRGSVAGFEPRRGERIGMVGYFRPVIDRLVEQGIEVLVIERLPERVPPRDRVELSEDLAALRSCRLVYCTASTLINDTLEQVLENCAAAEAIDLIGPSGSGLPDVLLERGIHAVGGVSFADGTALRDALARRENWGLVGNKYELAAANYPGAGSLLEAALANS